MLSRKLRIAVDARPLQHPHTGIGRYTQQLLKRLTTSGHEIIHCHTHGNALIQVINSQTRFGRIANLAKADLFWSPRHHLPLMPKNIPSVVTIHDLVWREAPETMPFSRRWTDRLLMQAALNRADRIIAVSQSTKADILKVLPGAESKTTVIHEAAIVSPAATLNPPNIKLPRPYALFVGTLEPRKNLRRLVEAFLASKIEGLQLIIAGHAGWGQVSIPEHQSITQLQPESDQELAALYTSAEFIIAPSLYEGFGLQVAEAIAFGKAVITSNISSLPEVAGEAAIYVNPKNIAEIQQAITRLAQNSVLRTELESKATLQAAKFSWARASEETINVFYNALTK